MILLMDGVTYDKWTDLSHDELVPMVKEHHKEIFGEASLYFVDIRARLRGGRIVAIPDGFCLTFNPDTLWVIEVELSTADRRHLVGQLNDSINGLGDPQTQRELRDALLNAMDEETRRRLRRQVGEPHPWLEGLIASASLLLVTEKATDEISRAVATLHPRICEFRTFRRRGAEAVHIHQFEPLVPLSATLTKMDKGGSKDTQPEPEQIKGRKVSGVSLAELFQAGILQPRQRIFFEFGGKLWEAEVHPSGKVLTLSDGKPYDSLSAAASHIKGCQENGWRCWQTKEANGQTVSLALLRERYLSRRGPL